MAQISSASKEQATGISQVNRAITDMDSNTQQNAARVEQVAASSDEMTKQANSLQKLISIFKVR